MILQNLSIKRKLTLITMLTSSMALILSSASFLIYDLVSFRHLLTQDLMTQAEIIGYNSAGAMEFKDEPAATATLSALTAKEDIMRMVSANKNYAVRAVKSYGDEIGRLIDGFNTMLAEIQQRDTALQSTNGELKTRTQELEEEIFHRKQTQEELLNAKHAAEEANRAKSTFLANMSHELRTPLNAIIGYSEMLEEETRDSGKIENVQDLRKIQASGKHLLSLINDVLDLSKIEAGKMVLHLETFEVSQVIEEMVTTLQPAAAKNGNSIHVQLANNVNMMRADITKVRQILFNLLSNACKFTDHGTVSVDVDQIKLENRDWIQSQVRDTGIGISAKQKENLFQEFAQADASIARKSGGTGLGLAITHRFVQLMKGRS